MASLKYSFKPKLKSRVEKACEIKLLEKQFNECDPTDPNYEKYKMDFMIAKMNGGN